MLGTFRDETVNERMKSILFCKEQKYPKMENNTQVSLPVNAALLCLQIWLEITLGFFLRNTSRLWKMTLVIRGLCIFTTMLNWE